MRACTLLLSPSSSASGRSSGSTTGPYRKVRHPIYTGIILGMVGTALATTLYGLIAVAVFAGFYIYSAFTEERNLARTFPETYPACKASTKMLIPYIF